MSLRTVRTTIAQVLIATILSIAIIPASVASAAGPNLVQNPSLETQLSSTTPANWSTGKWGTNATTFSYPVTGETGVGASVAVDSYTDGDAKWYFDSVAVTPGATYTFADSYMSTAPTLLVAQYTSASNALSYEQLGAALPATNGSWNQASANIVPPAGTASVTVFHLIQSVGSLATDNYSLTLASTGTSTGTTTPPGGGTGTTTATTTPGAFSKGIVTFTFDDGWLSQYTNAIPALNAANMKGSFYIIPDAMNHSEHTLFPSAANPFTVATTTKTAQWSPIYTDTSLHTFTFSNTYTATSRSTIVVTYTPTGKRQTSMTLGSVPAGTNAKARFTFTLPAITGPISIKQSVSGANTLKTSNVLLTQNIGYMDVARVQATKAAGHEIGNHTTNHCDLVVILNTPTDTSTCAFATSSPASALVQVVSAKADLANVGIPTDTFVYPYGSGANNATIQSILESNGIIAGRSVDVGYNTKNTNRYGLLTQNVGITTTAAQMRQWVDTAIANKTWLILTFHQVESTAAEVTEFGTTAAIFKNTVNYIATQRAAGKVEVDTMHNVVTNYLQ